MSEKKQKIVFVIPSLGSGGAERVVSTLASELSKRDYETAVMMIANDHLNYPLSDKVERIHLNCEQRHNGQNVLKRTIGRVRDIRAAIKKSGADVVISFMSDTNIDVCFAAWSLKVPVIVSERNDPAIDPASRAKQWMRKLAYCRADGFVFQTPDAQAYFNKKIQKKSCIILNPLTSLIPEVYEGQREKRIVAVGRLNKQKNFPLLIGAFAEFVKKEPEYILEIYGEGSLENDIRKNIEQKCLQEQVILKGFCKDVHEKIRSAAFFVMTSDFEGMPNALIEAMALGLPCISTDCPCGGPRMLIQPGENGLLFPVRNEEALLEAMHKMVSDPEAAAAMGKNACAIKEKVQLDGVTDQWIRYIQKICGEY